MEKMKASRGLLSEQLHYTAPSPLVLEQSTGTPQYLLQASADIDIQQESSSVVATDLQER